MKITFLIEKNWDKKLKQKRQSRSNFTAKNQNTSQKRLMDQKNFLCKLIH